MKLSFLGRFFTVSALIVSPFSYSSAVESVQPDSPQAEPPNRLSTGAAHEPLASDELLAEGTDAKTSKVNATTWVKLGNRLMQKSREVTESGLYERAERAYRNALLQDAKNEDAMVGLAWVHNTEHEFEEGRAWAEKALAINPMLSHAHALLGDSAVELGDYDAGLHHYQKALDIRPDLSSYSRAAHLVWLMGDVRKACWLMEKAIASGGNYAENVAWCRAELALLYWHDGALLPAEKQAELALKQAPRNAHVLAAMGKIKTARKEYDKAIEFYQRSIEVTPNHDSLVALGDLYSLTNQREEADKQYQRVMALHSSGSSHSHGDHVHSHGSEHGNAQLARFYADHDRNLDEALREAELAYKTYKNVFVADTLAWSYYKKGQYEKARDTIQEALRWKTPDAAIYFHAGMIQAKLGNRAKAQKYLLRALNLNPNFDPVYASQATETIQTLSNPIEQASRTSADKQPISYN